MIDRHVFRPDLLPKSTIFKVPEMGGSIIYVTEGLNEPEKEFRAIVHRERLEGLLFKVVWSSDEDKMTAR